MEVYLNKPWLASYDSGVPATLEIPEDSIPQAFKKVADQYGEKPAIIFYGKQLSFRELQQQVEALASSLGGLGIGKGDVVALYVLNSPQYIITYLATLTTGAAVTPVSPVFTSHELKYQLLDSGAKAILCQDILYDNLDKTGLKPELVIVTGVEEYLPPLRKILGKSMIKKFALEMNLPTPVIPKTKNIFWFQELLKSGKAAAPPVRADALRDLASISYSGGTTGPPKGVMLSHSQLLATALQLRAFYPFFERGKEVYPAFLPLYHAYGQMVVMIGGLLQGATLIIFTSPAIDDILDAIERYQVTVFFGVPTMYEFLKEYDKTSRVNWRRLKLILCGADTLHDRTVADWEKRTGSRITEGYGQTEGGGVTMANPQNKPKRGSIGVPMPNLTAAVVDADDPTRFLPVDEVGEIIITGPNVMLGYWNKPEATAEVLVSIDGELWLRTGDLGRMDEEGYFHYVDRKRDLIKFKGYSVFARDVEDVLYQHPQVKAAGVIGVPDARVGHIIKANVVLQPEARGKVSEEEIIRFCSERLSFYKVPKIVEFRGELPKTDVGKVSRRELREEEEA
jgi:long-chain acyl-CoA synthetase